MILSLTWMVIFDVFYWNEPPLFNGASQLVDLISNILLSCIAGIIIYILTSGVEQYHQHLKNMYTASKIINDIYSTTCTSLSAFDNRLKLNNGELINFPDLLSIDSFFLVDDHGYPSRRLENRCYIEPRTSAKRCFISITKYILNTEPKKYETIGGFEKNLQDFYSKVKELNSRQINNIDSERYFFLFGGECKSSNEFEYNKHSPIFGWKEIYELLNKLRLDYESFFGMAFIKVHPYRL